MNVLSKFISTGVMLLFVVSSFAQADSTSTHGPVGDEIEVNMPLLFVLLGGLVLVVLFLYKMLKRPNPYKDQEEKK